MGDAEITVSSWRMVEVGRVVVINGGGPSDGKLATIVEIIDHKRVSSHCWDFKPPKANADSIQALIDGPASDAKHSVPRQSIGLQKLVLTPFILKDLPRGARSGTVKKQWEKADIDAKWKESNWAKKTAQTQRRRALTDFERFKVMRLKKQSRWEVRKSLAKVKAAAK